MSYIIISLLLFASTIRYYPVQEISEKMHQNIRVGGNIAMFTEQDPLYSAVLMWRMSQVDKNRSIAIYRPCAFKNKNKTQILEALDRYNIYYIVYSPYNELKQIEEIKDHLELEFVVTENNFTTEVYRYKNFTYHPKDKICNYICVIKEEVCTEI